MSADVCQCVGAFCSGIIAFILLWRKKFGPQKENTFGDFLLISGVGGLADVLSVTFG